MASVSPRTLSCSRPPHVKSTWSTDAFQSTLAIQSDNTSSRFATLRDVLEHYDQVSKLGLTEPEKVELGEYLKSLWRRDQRPATPRQMRKPTAAPPSPHSYNTTVRHVRVLGPGLVTGAADDEPNGITACSVAGASPGHSMLWMVWVTYPLMAAIQLICARTGMVSGHGGARPRTS